ncbi:MAG: thioredoxin family protein [Calditrichaceae bacterium]|nr:thioredoxin family protein [Calditrichaceae bacterium]HES60001.1 thioredoxin family protein [Caldithrix sp.]
MKYKRYLLLLLIMLTVFVLECDKQYTTKTQYVPVTQFDPARDAAKDIADAIVEAKRTAKRILLDVGGDWCSWCHKLDSFFEQNKDIKQFLHENFIVVKINYSKENKNEAVLAQYPKAAGYPHLFVLNSDGTLLHSQNTGDLESGDHHDREKVITFLKTWARSSK